MFSDQQTLVSQLKDSNPRFQALFDKHNRLDQEIAKLEGPNGAGYNDEVVKLKKEKLHLKDEMQKLLQQAEK
ncbi:MAG TPA: hypothetical protein DEV59_13735 [Proteus sp.]|uniref:DUF465 domain-containing protein n=1 Tax=Proteus hauseri TaxID=183417 RepID=UPI000EBB9C96|nr:DUF465 domain-containing protein [Proteus hauseri]QAV22172.1 hypothetical protein PH4a_01945 [Proteus hauseri]HCH51731.1 hypothetical protein [Proteus sp. (in: enterobacteria)]